MTPGIEAGHLDLGDESSSSRHMLVPSQEVRSEAKEEEIGDAASRALGGADILLPVPEPVV